MSDHGPGAQIQVAPDDTLHCGKGSPSFDAYRMEHSLKSDTLVGTSDIQGEAKPGRLHSRSRYLSDDIINFWVDGG